ncbi:pyruvyl transferase EpsO [Bisgaardia hudsonensis]|uniref:Pyruvyl transferase EpsO n=1 Tax=Bisgaardia hudsonensis TaxID=109472 RepID=A0A4V6NQ78_9PAST|nr:polysaccharide pyruvyl transferase family protein [Bisgaardia hudsonensis]QLB13787.1 hypothetical protein A6A11_09295 [Bisgaardia hudsonensis]TCP11730.1 pyruvyl transferase EpsO [Bisgaardia hudsonensis]
MENNLTILKDHLNKIADLIINKNDVIYVDIPIHTNVGDLLIYYGTEQFFLNHDINIKLRMSVIDFNISYLKKFISPETTILCHGGGNFGDIYEIHQNLRYDIINNFKKNRIILLPQTVFFKNNNNLNNCINIYSNHSQCYLLARDINSQLVFEQLSKKVILSPDMAHELYNVLPHKKNNSHLTNNVLYFIRNDIEKVDHSDLIPIDSQTKDWDTLIKRSYLSKKIFKTLKILIKFSKLLKIKSLNNLVYNLYFQYSLHIIKQAVNKFMQYDKIVTNRLHGHILSELLEIENKILDNSYGKNISYYKLWTKKK